MEKHFIRKVKINKLRHLKDIEIKIDELMRKTLIITGKSGSGKTTILEGMKDLLQYFETGHIDQMISDFDIDIDNSKPVSYKDIIFNKNELNYVKEEVKEFEKKYFNLKEKKALENLDFYKEKIKDYDGTKGLIMEVVNMDSSLLKSISDSLVNYMGKGFVFFSNIKNKNSINFIARSTCSINAGFVVKEASVASLGNGGGSPTFASGGGRDMSKLKDIYNYVEKEIINEK